MAVHYGNRTVKVAEPSSLQEAWHLKQEGGAGAVYVSGGTLLRTQWENGVAPAPSLMIGLDGVKKYSGIAFDAEKEELVIGALTSLEDCRRSCVLAEHAPVLVQAVSAIAAPSIRRLATLGGNIASLSGDAVTALLALDAELVLYRGGPEPEIMSLVDWLEGGSHARENGALILEVAIPASERTGAAGNVSRIANGVGYSSGKEDGSGTASGTGSISGHSNETGTATVVGNAAQGEASEKQVELRGFSFFEKLGRREAFTPSVVTVAAIGSIDRKGRFRQVRLVAGGGAALPHRLYEAERYLNGQTLGRSSIAALHTLIREGCAVAGDPFAGADYRKEVSANLLTARLWTLLEL
ncbi:FAD binding domain-containing protein [Paenibacillus sp. CAU 1782]